MRIFPNIVRCMAASSDVAERLQAVLAERDILPGDRLPFERQLAGGLGIARPSLREELRRPVDLDIVKVSQGSGTYPTGVDLTDLLQMRLRLEPYAARLGAQRRDARQLTELDGAIGQLRDT